jgi:hypothetical protein
MINRIVLLCTLVVTSSAHAELLVARGAKATLHVTYEYTATGNYVSSSKDNTKSWKVRRTVELTTQMVADAQQPIGVMHKQDASQVADMQNKQALAESAQRKMSPMANDMMKLAEKCGSDEACLQREVMSYANTSNTAQAMSARSEVASLTKQSGPRYQLWKSTGQSGIYSVDETYSRQVFEMTCNKTDKQCKSEEIRKGAGEIPPPLNGKSTSGATMIEVDSVKKDMAIMLPVPLAPLTDERKLTTIIPGERSATTKGTVPNIFGAIKPITVSISSGGGSASGTETIKLNGADGEGGTLVAKWQFVVQ